MPGLPWQLGGSGDLNRLIEGWPTWPRPPLFDLYFSISLGYHLEAMYHIFAMPRTHDFVEMLAHHVATLLTLTGTFLANVHQIGAMTLWLHHWADIFSAVSRATSDLRNPIYCPLFFFPLILVFAYSRLYCFPLVAHAGLNFELGPGSHYPHMAVFLSCVLLYIIHCYWMFAMVKIAANKLRTGRNEDAILNRKD